MVNLDEPGVWTDQAAADLEHARESLRLGHYEWACYAAQQSAAKYLKALILRTGERFLHTHHLNVLAEQAAGLGLATTGLPSVKALVDLSDKNFLARYPLHGAKSPRAALTREHADEAVATAEGVAWYALQMLGPGEAGQPPEPT